MKLKRKDIIVKCRADTFMPLAAMFGICVIMHGDSSPGGGFQGGILTVAVVLLIYLAHGYEEAKRALHPNLTHKLEGVALMLYVVLAFVGVVLGASFCQNVFYYHGDIGALFSSGTVFWMGETVAFDVFTAAVTLSIGMLSVLYPQDIDNLK